MLEKIGLPPKPSLRGNNWVVDASHCQGCSSQFTFINRKHHCRRCGGLFCGNCTQQRMLLRGQGDSPVRICEPCKKLEEAARFEMRHGHKNKTGRGGLKPMSNYEDDILKQILGRSGKESAPSGLESPVDGLSGIQQATSSASCSNIKGITGQDQGVEIPRSFSVEDPTDVLTEMGSATPEELRQQALNEKQRYKILKAEGKSAEALIAFKRGKELERQAGALDIYLRKNRKKAMSSSNITEGPSTKDDTTEAGTKIKLPSQVSKEKDDIGAELRELGWSDADLRVADKKPASMSLEGELSSLLGEVHRKTNMEKGTHDIDKSEVIAHKKRALALKREGNLAEAKEELKRAKILEKQIEEQELLVGAEDSDEELSSLMHGMDADKQNDFSIRHAGDPGFDFDRLLGIADDIDADIHFEVTDDEDMDDPEIAATLKSIGWTEEPNYPDDNEPQYVPIDRDEMSSEIQSLKKEALSQKRAGNSVEAMALLRKAKLLERDLENIDSQEISLSAKKPSTNQLDAQDVGRWNDMDSKLVPKSRIEIQKELLSLKKSALALRREGRLDEANEELNKGKVLEQQLEEIDNVSKVKTTSVNVSSNHNYNSTALHVTDEDDVTDQDLNDPMYLSVLRNLGWKDGDNENISSLHFKENYSPVLMDNFSSTGARGGASKRSKSEIQRELLGLKRKSLALRRQGKDEEAEEVLKMARQLEVELAETEAPRNKEVPAVRGKLKKNETYNLDPNYEDVDEDQGIASEDDMQDPALLSMLKNLGWQDEPITASMLAKPSEDISNNLEPSDVPINNFSTEIPIALPKRSKTEIQKELLGLKRKALALRRQGKTEEAEEVLKLSRALEAEIEGVQETMNQPLSDSSKKDELENDSVISNGRDINLKDVVGIKEETTQATAGLDSKVVEWPEGFGLKERGTTEPPAKRFDISVNETFQLSEGNKHILVDVGPSFEMKTTVGSSILPPPVQSGGIMDLLTGDNWSTSQTSLENTESMWGSRSSSSSLANFPVLQDSHKSPSEDLIIKNEAKHEKRDVVVHQNEELYIAESKSAEVTVSWNDRNSLQQSILAHKRKAVTLKREGKLAEAKEELRQAKHLEKRLEGDNSHPSSGSSDISSSTVASIQLKERSSSRPLSSRDRFKLQQESLSHKRQALKFRREGRVEEAEAESELAKALEAQLEELSAHDSIKSSVNAAEAADDVNVEDFLDPQLLSALKAIGLNDTGKESEGPGRAEPARTVSGKIVNSSGERTQLEEQIKAEKVKAVNLKRSGKPSEALDALRRSKILEKKLNSLASK